MTTQEREKVETERHEATVRGFLIGVGICLVWFWVIVAP